jgi:hypothetical protein
MENWEVEVVDSSLGRQLTDAAQIGASLSNKQETVKQTQL